MIFKCSTLGYFEWQHYKPDLTSQTYLNLSFQVSPSINEPSSSINEHIQRIVFKANQFQLYHA